MGHPRDDREGSMGTAGRRAREGCVSPVRRPEAVLLLRGRRRAVVGASAAPHLECERSVGAGGRTARVPVRGRRRALGGVVRRAERRAERGDDVPKHADALAMIASVVTAVRESALRVVG